MRAQDKPPHGSDKLFVMRHGKTALDKVKRSDGWLDLPLSEEGQTQVVEAQQRLKNVPIKCIYAPPLKRCKESAEILQSGIEPRPEIEISPEAKTWNLGRLAGSPKKPNKPIVGKLMEQRNSKPDGGESYAEFEARLKPWLKKQVAEVRAGKGPNLIVASGSVCRWISDYLYHDKSILDLDEAGIMVLYPTGGKSFGAQVVCGRKSDGQEDYS